MPCPVNKCVTASDGSVDHRWCLVELFKTERIKSLADWEEMCKPKTVVKKKVKVRVPKE